MAMLMVPRCPWMSAGSTEWPHPDWGWSEHKSPLNFLGVKKKGWVWSKNERWGCLGYLRLFFSIV